MPQWFYTYFVHILSGRGYQFWSGIGSDIGEVTLLGLAAVWWRSHNCHIYGCWRLSWHPHPLHGHPVCRKHYPNYKQIGRETTTDGLGTATSSSGKTPLTAPASRSPT